MQLTEKTYFYSRKRQIAPRFLFVFLFFLLFGAPAYAATDVDPFQLETTHWMSFNRYKDKIKNGAVLPLAPTESDATRTEAPSPPDSDAAPANSESADGAPVVATPTRPINPPVMPSMNKGYDIRITSTETDKPPVAQITHIDSQPTVHIPDSNWESATDIARQTHGNTGSDDHTPLNVRMSFLPNEQITPIPTPDRKAGPSRVKAVLARAAVAKEPEKSPADLAACAAIDAYKKKQLEAIQGDRQTLAALQAAIAQLGLQKQLNFMSGADTSISTQADNTPANMDIAPSLTRSSSKN